MEAHFLHPPPGSGPFCHAPSLALAPGGDLVAAWYAYPEDECAGAVLVSSRLSPGAEEWSPAARLPIETRRSLGNPVLFTAPDGRLRLLYVILEGAYWNDARLFGVASPDGGRTWSPPEPAFPVPGTMVRHPPAATADGRLLLPAYDERSRRSFLLESRSPWTRWREGARFDGADLIQPVLLDGGGGRMTALFRPAAERRRIHRSISTDGGTTWSPPIVTALPSPPSGIAGFGAGDSILAVYNHTEEHRRTPLSVARSPDRGLTWGAPVHVETAPFEVSYPSAARDGSGRVHLLYRYNRRMIKAGLKELRGLHEGKRVFILASGPSLKTHDLAPLSRRLTIGLNRSILALPDPTYHCCMDHRLFDEYAEGLRRVRCLFTLEDRPWGIPLKLLGTEGWSWDLEQGLYSGYTIAYFALQVAVYLGFREIYLLGLDLRLQNGQTHFFGSDYRSKDHESTEFPKMRRMLSRGALALKEQGIRVFNCSPVSDLDCFTRRPYEEAVKL